MVDGGVRGLELWGYHREIVHHVLLLCLVNGGPMDYYMQLVLLLAIRSPEKNFETSIALCP
jgi:hypothetical protein